MNNFSPGISPIGSTTQIAPSSSLLGMLQDLINSKMGVSSLGANRVHVNPGEVRNGYIDPMGNYHDGFQGMFN